MMDALYRFAARWHARAIYWTTWLWRSRQPTPQPATQPVPHVGADLRYAAELHATGELPTPDHLTTRQDRLDQAADLHHTLNDIEADLFAGLNDVMDWMLHRLDLSYVDLMEHGGWAGVHELVEVGA